MSGNFAPPALPSIIASFTTPITNTGDTTENTLFEFTVPGGFCFAPGHRVEIGYRANVSANTNTKTLRVRHVTQANAVIQANAFNLANQVGIEVLRRLTYHSPTTYLSPVAGLMSPDFGSNPNAFPYDPLTPPFISPIDWSMNNVFRITGQLGVGTDSIVLLESVVRVIR